MPNLEGATSTCGDPNPGSPWNAPCHLTPEHQDNHSNGFSEWTNAGAARHDRGTAGRAG